MRGVNTGLYETVTDYIWAADDFLWSIAMVLIVMFGIYATIAYKGIQLTRLKHAVSLTLGDIKTKNTDGKISSFEAFCISMGARIGVGNIAGTASAIMCGGPGAVFWMWVFALIGSASSYVETIIGQLYKEKKSDGECYGGPAYYASKGFNSRAFGIVVAFIVFAMFAIGFAGIECCSASNALCNAFDMNNDNGKLIIAIIITALFAPIALGGARRVAKVSSKVVPIMALGWILFGIVIICINITNVPNAFGMIFYYAFNPVAVIGGGIGEAISYGMKRGVFSNEAGIGTVTGISSTANVEHPAKQAHIQALGVLVDTLIISTLSAVIILSFGDFNAISGLPEFADSDGIGLLQNIATQAVGSVASYVVAFFVFIFAFTCLVSDYLTSEINMRFIKDHRMVIWGLRIFLICMVFFACMARTEDMFDLLDICMAITGIVNIFCITYLAKQAKAVHDDYARQLKEGVETPVFHKSVLKDTDGITEWD